MVSGFLLALAWFLVVPRPDASGAASGSAPGSAGRALAEVSFSRPVSDEEVRRIAREHGVEVEMAQGEFEIGGQVYQEGFTGDGGEDLERERLASFADMVESSKDLPEKDRREMEPEISAMKEALERGDAGTASVRSATFAGEEAALQALAREEEALISDARVMTVERLLRSMRSLGPLEAEPKEQR